MGLEDLRSVCTLAPGAMGQTGIETAELISALVRQISFSSIIAVDALAARSMGRLGATVQFSTSGIAPGSGVHNRRAELSERTLGIPVFSLGIPTVVDAVTMMPLGLQHLRAGQDRAGAHRNAPRHRPDYCAGLADSGYGHQPRAAACAVRQTTSTFSWRTSLSAH
jgi:hypothetical protein